MGEQVQSYGNSAPLRQRRRSYPFTLGMASAITPRHKLFWPNIYLFLFAVKTVT